MISFGNLWAESKRMPEWAKPVVLTAAIGLAAYLYHKVHALILGWFKRRYDSKVVQYMKSVHRTRVEAGILSESAPCYITADEIAEGMHRSKKRVMNSLRRLRQKGIVEPFSCYWRLPAHELVD
jgi:hypothetical protein